MTKYPGNGTRIYGIAECCGRTYWRWRKANVSQSADYVRRTLWKPGNRTQRNKRRHMFITPRNCRECGNVLQFKSSAGTAAASAKRSYLRRKVLNYNQGLTVKGTVRLWPRYWDDEAARRAARQASQRKANRIRRERNWALGLTECGKPRKKNSKRASKNPVEVRYRQFRAEMDTDEHRY